MIYCCKGCEAPKRYPGCHAICPEYIAEKAEHDRMKAEADRNRSIQVGLTSQTMRGVNKAFKAQKRLKGR